MVHQTKKEDRLPDSVIESALARLVSDTRLVSRSLRHDTHVYEIVSEFLIPWIWEQKQKRESARLFRRRLWRGAWVAAIIIVAVVSWAIWIKISTTETELGRKLEKSNGELLQANNELKEKKNEVFETKRQLDGLKRELETVRKERDSTKSDLERTKIIKDTQLSKSTNEKAEADLVIQGLRTTLETKSSQLRNTIDQLQSTSNQLASVTQDRESARSDLNGTQTELTRVRGQLATRERELETARNTLEVAKTAR